VLQLTEEQLYLHTALFDLGQLQIQQLDHHLALRIDRHFEFLNDEQKGLCHHLLV